MANRKKFYKLYSEDKDCKPPSYKPGTDIHVLIIMFINLLMVWALRQFFGIDSVWYIVFIYVKLMDS